MLSRLLYNFNILIMGWLVTHKHAPVFDWLLLSKAIDIVVKYCFCSSGRERVLRIRLAYNSKHQGNRTWSLILRFKIAVKAAICFKTIIVNFNDAVSFFSWLVQSSLLFAQDSVRRWFLCLCPNRLMFNTQLTCHEIIFEYKVWNIPSERRFNTVT